VSETGARNAPGVPAADRGRRRPEARMPVDFSMPILVVDDEPMMVDVIMAVAARAGFEDVEPVSTVRDALVRLQQKRFGLVISDFELGVGTGLDLLTLVRESDGLGHLRFMMISAHKRPDYIAAAGRGGVDYFLCKPFSPKTLQDKIEQICATPVHRERAAWRSSQA
jgi:two-component system chemotaxis response regulator CheY